MELMELLEKNALDGFVNAGRRHTTPEYERALAQTVALLENHNGYGHHHHLALLEEAAGTSDFPLLFADALDRKVLAAFRAVPNPLRPIVQIDLSIPDFRAVKRFQFDKYIGRLKEVKEFGEYTDRKPSELKYEYGLKKWGAVVPFSWEAFMNDDLGLLQRIPDGLAQSAIQTEMWFITQLFMNAAGALDAYFAHATLGQKAVSSLPLSIANLQVAIEEMTGSGGNSTNFRMDDVPMVNVPRFLMVPPALQTTAMDILRATQVQWTLTGSTDVTKVQQPVNTAIGTYGIVLIINPWIPLVVTTGSLGQTSWFLFSETIKPAEVGFLRGRNAPELFMESSNAVRLGGGLTNPFDGGFENDTIKYKIRHCLNGTLLDPRGGWASDGQ